MLSNPNMRPRVGTWPRIAGVRPKAIHPFDAPGPEPLCIARETCNGEDRRRPGGRSNHKPCRFERVGAWRSGVGVDSRPSNRSQNRTAIKGGPSFLHTAALDVGESFLHAAMDVGESVLGLLDERS